MAICVSSISHPKAKKYGMNNGLKQNSWLFVERRLVYKCKRSPCIYPKHVKIGKAGCNLILWENPEAILRSPNSRNETWVKMVLQQCSKTYLRWSDSNLREGLTLSPLPLFLVRALELIKTLPDIVHQWPKIWPHNYNLYGKAKTWDEIFFSPLRPSHTTTETAKKVVIVHTHYILFYTTAKVFSEKSLWKSL